MVSDFAGTFERQQGESAMDLHFSQLLSPGRKEFIKGTLLLTGAGLFCRVLGFFYRIYMSRTIGAEGLGLYNMIHPLFSIAFAVCAGSIQTALSQYVAANRERGRPVFLCGLVLSFSLSLIPVLLLCKGKIFLASYILSEPQAARYLPVLAVSVPFACLHACINGYYYGMNKAHIPSFSQIAEQVIRMIAVWLLVGYLEKNGKPVTVGLAVEGHLIGEMASAVFTFLALLLVPPQKRERKEGQKETRFENAGRQRWEQKCGKEEEDFGDSPIFANLGPILTLALPLMGKRLVLNLLGSAEAILIPSRLIDYGLTNKEALSIYGVLTSMALPFILFPSAITNSMAVLLLPSAARAQAQKDKNRISTMVTLSFKCSCYMGILCIGLFTRFGKSLGTIIFHNEMSGSFIMVLCWLCPFMYLATTMGSIQNGLGRTGVTFLQNMFAMGIRLVFVMFAVPVFGIRGYLWGFLVSELMLAFLCCFSVGRQVTFSKNMTECILKPALALFIAMGVDLLLSVSAFWGFSFMGMVLHMGVITLCYVLFLVIF